MARLKGRYLSEDGKTVDYVGLKGDKLFQEFEGLSNQLVHADLAELSSIQRKAFFISMMANNNLFSHYVILNSCVSCRYIQHFDYTWLVPNRPSSQFCDRSQQLLEAYCLLHLWLCFLIG